MKEYPSPPGWKVPPATPSTRAGSLPRGYSMNQPPRRPHPNDPYWQTPPGWMPPPPQFSIPLQTPYQPPRRNGGGLVRLQLTPEGVKASQKIASQQIESPPASQQIESPPANPSRRKRPFEHAVGSRQSPRRARLSERGLENDLQIYTSSSGPPTKAARKDPVMYDDNTKREVLRIMLRHQNIYGKDNPKFWKHVKDEISRGNLIPPVRLNTVTKGWIEKYKNTQNPHRTLSGEEATCAYDAEMKAWILVDNAVKREDKQRHRTANQIAEDNAVSTKMQYDFMMNDNMITEYGEEMFRPISPSLYTDPYDDHLLHEPSVEIVDATNSAPLPASAPLSSSTPASSSVTEDIIMRRPAVDVTPRVRIGPPSRSVQYNQGMTAANGINAAVNTMIEAANERAIRSEARMAERNVILDKREDMRLELDRDRLAAEIRREDSIQQLAQRVEQQGIQLSTQIDSKLDRLMAVLQQRQ